jgi:hypothetical protein
LTAEPIFLDEHHWTHVDKNAPLSLILFLKEDLKRPFWGLYEVIKLTNSNGRRAIGKHSSLPIYKADEGKTEGKTIQPSFTKLDNIGQHSHAKRLRSPSKQQPGDLKKPLAEFDSPPSFAYF